MEPANTFCGCSTAEARKDVDTKRFERADSILVAGGTGRQALHWQRSVRPGKSCLLGNPQLLQMAGPVCGWFVRDHIVSG